MARGRRGNPVHGWLILDKPAGPSSAAMVAKARRALDARKAGHAGTLDPPATGVLAVALGEATKTVPFVVDAAKTYRFTVRWGAATDTDDATGSVTATSDARPDAAAIRAALPAFTGAIAQVPPQVSAVKVAGERAYALARAGAARRDLAARALTRRAARPDRDCPDPDTAELEMVCGKGGYVRVDRARPRDGARLPRPCRLAAAAVVGAVRPRRSGRSRDAGPARRHAGPDRAAPAAHGGADRAARARMPAASGGGHRARQFRRARRVRPARRRACSRPGRRPPARHRHVARGPLSSRTRFVID
jgi:tRNA pseudouridine(55) synthase